MSLVSKDSSKVLDTVWNSNTDEVSKFSLKFAYAFGEPKQALFFRETNSDFIVDEIFNKTLSGEGEHYWLKIKKDGENTHWIALQLAKYFNVKDNDVGYAGMKDRHAITSQWYSIYLPGKPHKINWEEFVRQSKVNAQCLEESSHFQKLKRGMHDGNRFSIRLTNVVDVQDLDRRLNNIREEGVPNYFGEQRFGRNAQNLQSVSDWFVTGKAIRNRQKKSLAISSARSYLFNWVLSERVEQGSWNIKLDGDIESEKIKYPTGPMWGRGRSLSFGDTFEVENLALEKACLDDYKLWCDKLEHSGLNQERRSLILQAQNLSWRFIETDLELSFDLSPGEFATSVLRELAFLLSPQR